MQLGCRKKITASWKDSELQKVLGLSHHRASETASVSSVSESSEVPVTEVVAEVLPPPSSLSLVTLYQWGPWSRSLMFLSQCCYSPTPWFQYLQCLSIFTPWSRSLILWSLCLCLLLLRS